jgi:RNA polymerase sigma factor (TIGR02999 family)
MMVSNDPRPDVTLLLNRLLAGDAEAAPLIAPLIYDELRVLAGAAFEGGNERTLQPTALVHEAWLRFAGSGASFENRRQFFALAAKVMRSVLVDHARARAAQKRGGAGRRITFDDGPPARAEQGYDVLEVDEVLRRLESLDPELHQLVELRFFGGLSHKEIAEATGTPLRTVERRWTLARAWMRSELDG